MVFLKDLFEKVNLKKKCTDDKKTCKITQHAKSYTLLSPDASNNCWKMANSVDPDQRPNSAASDLGDTGCSGLSVPMFRVNMVI